MKKNNCSENKFPAEVRSTLRRFFCFTSAAARRPRRHTSEVTFPPTTDEGTRTVSRRFWPYFQNFSFKCRSVWKGVNVVSLPAACEHQRRGITCTWLRASPPAGAPSAAAAPAGQNRLRRERRRTDVAAGRTLTFSFLNSSYSGLSVGSSSRQSGQEFVYDRKHKFEKLKFPFSREAGARWPLPSPARAGCIPRGTGVCTAFLEPSPSPRTPVNTRDTSALYLRGHDGMLPNRS